MTARATTGGGAEKVLAGQSATMLAFDYPPNHGGIARLCSEIVAGLDQRGCDVHVVSHEYALEKGSLVYPVAHEFRAAHQRGRREAETLLHMLKARGATGPVICGTWYPEGLIARVACVHPLVVLAHGLELMPTREVWRRAAWGRMQRGVLESAELVIANSEYTKALTLSTAPKARVEAIPLAVDHVRFSPGDRAAARAKFGVGEGKRVVTTVARVEGYKAHDTVLRALAAMPREARRETLYLVAGRGPALMGLKQLAERLGLEENVRWLGFVAEEDLADLYRATDLFVLATRESKDAQAVEGFGLVYLEAQACGTPVVGTTTGGIRDAVKPGRGGFLIAPDDIHALTELLVRLWREPDVFVEEGARGRARVEAECTWAHYLETFIGVMSDAGLLALSGR